MPGGYCTSGMIRCRRRRDTQRRAAGLCQCDLRAQNDAFAGTGGVSAHNRAAGFVPAYQNTDTGETRISRFADGRPAPVHVLDGLPAHWIGGRDDLGAIVRTIPAVIAGFMRNGRFYTREAAARVLAGSTAALPDDAAR